MIAKNENILAKTTINIKSLLSANFPSIKLNANICFKQCIAVSKFSFLNKTQPQTTTIKVKGIAIILDDFCNKFNKITF